MGRSWRELPIKLTSGATLYVGKPKPPSCFCVHESFSGRKAHRTRNREEAEAEVLYALGEYKDIIENYLAIPVLIGRKAIVKSLRVHSTRPLWNQLCLTEKRCRWEPATILGQHFAKVFDIKYIGEDKSDHYVWQTSWGITYSAHRRHGYGSRRRQRLIMPPKLRLSR